MIQQLDFAILDWIQQNLKSDILDLLMPLITKLGDGGIFFIALTLFLLCTKRYRHQGKAMLYALLLCLVCGNLLLKPLVGRIRPYDLVDFELLIAPLSDFSFPSGHTMVSAAVATVMVKYRKSFGVWSAVMVVAAVLVGFSRLYLYVHFPTDVLSGAVLGVLLALAAVYANDKKSDNKA